MGRALPDVGYAILKGALRTEGREIGNLGLEGTGVLRRGIHNGAIERLDSRFIPRKARRKALRVRIKTHAKERIKTVMGLRKAHRKSRRHDATPSRS